MRFAWLFVAAILLVGLAGTAVALHSREQDSGWVARHEVLAPVGAPQLEHLLLTTSDPRPTYSGRAGLVRCHSAAATAAAAATARATTPASNAAAALGNPWTCMVRYPAPPPVRFRVTVHADRSIFGAGQPAGSPRHNFLTVSGCCVAAGAAP